MPQSQQRKISPSEPSKVLTDMLVHGMDYNRSEALKEVKKRNNPRLKLVGIKSIHQFIELMLLLRRELKVTVQGFFLLMMVWHCNSNGIDAVATRLAILLYEEHNQMRQVRYRLATLVRNGNIYKEGNKYYLTSKAIEAINRIAL